MILFIMIMKEKKFEKFLFKNYNFFVVFVKEVRRIEKNLKYFICLFLI